jgi:hypothetical protein
VIVARVVNGSGRTFNVRLVRKGDRYGLNDCLVHDKDEPMVEFYDATYERDARFDLGRGQFVARYYLDTLEDSYGRTTRCGLDLCGHEPAWKISGTNVVETLAAVGGAIAAIAASRQPLLGGSA